MVDLSKYNKKNYKPGAGLFKRCLWYLINAIVLNSWFFPSSALKCAVLRAFGATIGTGVVIKPRVNIKYPWFLSIGDYSWIGEGVWIDNLTWVHIGSNVCISQEVYLLTGNHDYKDPHFGLMVNSITIEDGAWIGARSIVCPGVKIGRLAVITAGSVLSSDAVQNGIYRGNPAELFKKRELK